MRASAWGWQPYRITIYLMECSQQPEREKAYAQERPFLRPTVVADIRQTRHGGKLPSMESGDHLESRFCGGERVCNDAHAPARTRGFCRAQDCPQDRWESVSREPAEFKNGYAPVIGPTLPAVVNISSTKVVKQNNTPSLFFNDPLFRQFFGDQFDQQHATPRTEPEYSLGSR